MSQLTPERLTNIIHHYRTEEIGVSLSVEDTDKAIILNFDPDCGEVVEAYAVFRYGADWNASWQGIQFLEESIDGDAVVDGYTVNAYFDYGFPVDWPPNVTRFIKDFVGNALFLNVHLRSISYT